MKTYLNVSIDQRSFTEGWRAELQILEILFSDISNRELDANEIYNNVKKAIKRLGGYETLTIDVYSASEKEREWQRKAFLSERFVHSYDSVKRGTASASTGWHFPDEVWEQIPPRKSLSEIKQAIKTAVIVCNHVHSQFKALQQ